MNAKCYNLSNKKLKFIARQENHWNESLNSLDTQIVDGGKGYIHFTLTDYMFPNDSNKVTIFFYFG